MKPPKAPSQQCHGYRADDKELAAGTLRPIIRQSGMSVEEFLVLL